MFAILIALAIPIVHQMRCGAATLLDSTQMVELHQFMLVDSASRGNRLLLPSRIVADGASNSVEDYTLNHTAAMYSYMVGAGFVEPERLVSHSCIEVNSLIEPKTDYNYAAYQPINGSYWDPTFVMRIDDPKTGANASYAHNALCGDRLRRWTSNSDSTWAILGTRGPKNGAESGPEYSRSPTLRLFGSKKTWAGNIVFADNHSATEDTFYPRLSYYEVDGEKKSDNIFSAEFTHQNGNHAAGDAFLGISISASKNKVGPVWDSLD